MTQEIKQEIEEKHPEIQILFIVEVGSRTWGTSSPSSDHDFKFVYCYPKSNYLKLFTNIKNTYRLFWENPKGSFDIEGWDIFKFLRLFAKSNPSTLEWVRSTNAVFDSEILIQLRKISKRFDPYTLIQHYLSMAKDNHRKYIADKIDPSLKIYLHVIRSVLSAIYIIEKKSFPPLKISSCLQELYQIDQGTWDIKLIQDEIQQLISSKQLGDEIFKPSSSLNFWIHEILDDLESRVNILNRELYSNEIDKRELEDLLAEILNGNS